MESIQQISPTTADADVIKITRLKEQRLNREPRDMLQLTEAFPEAVRIPILNKMAFFEITDGCTGGCPWCAFDVKRKITSGFTFESIEQFFKKYAQYLPGQISLYWATDPVDIAGHKEDGSEYDYSDVLTAILPNLRGDQTIYTSTALPLGTDEVMEKIYRLLYRELWSKGKKHNVRISVKPETKERAEALKARLIASGLDRGYVEWQFSNNEYKSEGSNTIQYVGKYSRHPKRNINNSITSVACYDGCLLNQQGVMSITSEAVTRKNIFGQTQTLLDPNAKNFYLPRFVMDGPYRPDNISYKIVNGPVDGIKLLPDVVVDIYDREGTITKTETRFSVRRDLQILTLLNTAVTLINNFPDDKRVMTNSLTQGIDRTIRIAPDKYRESCHRNKDSCDDPEALSVLSAEYIGIIDQALNIIKTFSRNKLSS